MTEPYPFPTSADEFADKRVLVTGGTRGIGAAVVRRFQLAGARVAATARSAPADPVDGAVFIAADIGTAAGADAMVSRLTADWGGLDILVNNAGAAETKPGGFEGLSDADWQVILDLNLMGAVRLDRAFVPRMIERKSGVVIHIGSVAARLPFANSTLAYAAAKAALTTYSKGLAKAVASHGVRVTMISPGFIETTGAHGMIADIVRNTAPAKLRRANRSWTCWAAFRSGGPASRRRSPSWSHSWLPTAAPSSVAPTMCWTAGPSQPSDRQPPPEGR